MTLNILSFRQLKKRRLFETMIIHEQYDIVILTETWFEPKFLDSFVGIDQFTIAARIDRKVNQRNINKPPGGGVIIYVRNNIKFHAPTVKNIDDYAQVASLKIKDLRVIGVYRKPANVLTLDKRLKSYIQTTFSEENLVITGDINLPHTDWINGVHPSRPSRLWRDLSSEMGLHQHVHEPTCTSGNQLDLVFSRSSNSLIVDNVIVDNLLFKSITDHHCVRFDTQVVFCKKIEKKTILDIRNADWDAYELTMKNFKMIPKVANTSDPDNKWSIISESIEASKATACPTKDIVEGRAPKWVSHHLQTQLRKEQRLRAATKQPGNAKTRKARLQRWRHHHLKVKSKIQKSRNEYETKRVLEFDKNPIKLFSDVKRARTVNMASPPVNDLEGRILTSDLEKAEAFQAKFVSVFTPKREMIIDWSDIPGGLNHITFSTTLIKKAIKALKTSSAPGHDGIGPIFYKKADLSLVFALADLYTTCFENLTLPKDFLVSKVISIWKNKGQISDITTFRGITLCIIAFKIMECIIVWAIVKHLEDRKLIDAWQHGFQRKRSCITNLISSWEFISSEVDKGEKWISCSLDLSSAFDQLSISHLMLALKDKGIGGKLGAFLEYWLNNRSQFVQVGTEKSSLADISSGVPQGSTGGPTYFNCLLSSVYKDIYTEGAEINLHLWAFADDTRLVFQAKNDNDFNKAQAFMDIFSEKLSAVGLKLNPSKSVMVYYGNQSLKRHLAVDGVNIPIEPRSVELGCIFSNNMSFKPSIERNVSKANAFIFAIRNSMNARNLSVLKKLYQVYFIPILLYGCQLWHGNYEYVKDQLYSMHRKFWRLGLGRVLPDGHVLDPFQQSLKSNLMFLHQMKHGGVDMDFNEYFESKERTSTRSDNPLDLKIPKNRLVSRDNFFTTNMTRIFNDLPDNLKNERSYERFKSGIINFILDTNPTPVYDYRPWKQRFAQRVQQN